jgi:nucleoside-diphosphate-sugar epimerase
MKRVLVTGMSGLIGGLLRSHLDSLGRYDLSALNRTFVDGVECHQADIVDLEAIKPAFLNKEIVVHLSADASGDDWHKLRDANIIGTYNVYEAARLTGVKRIIFASSCMVSRGFQYVAPYDAIARGDYDKVPRDFEKITHDMMRPMSVYGATKVWGEALGRHYSDAYGISIICLRLGTLWPDDRPHVDERRKMQEYANYMGHRDCVQVIEKAIEAPDDLMYDIFYVDSDNKWSYKDISHTQKTLGYKPQDSADKFM